LGDNRDGGWLWHTTWVAIAADGHTRLDWVAASWAASVAEKKLAYNRYSQNQIEADHPFEDLQLSSHRLEAGNFFGSLTLHLPEHSLSAERGTS
jgi:hypothetical protein